MNVALTGECTEPEPAGSAHASLYVSVLCGQHGSVITSPRFSKQVAQALSVLRRTRMRQTRKGLAVPPPKMISVVGRGMRRDARDGVGGEVLIGDRGGDREREQSRKKPRSELGAEPAAGQEAAIGAGDRTLVWSRKRVWVGDKTREKRY